MKHPPRAPRSFSVRRWIKGLLGQPPATIRKQSYRPRLELLEDRLAPAVTATLTADNHYGLFYGNADGSNLTLVGRNEFGYNGNPGTYNWSQAEAFTFDPPDGAHLFVVAWDSELQQMLIGQFAQSSGGTLRPRGPNDRIYLMYVFPSLAFSLKRITYDNFTRAQIDLISKESVERS